MTNDEINAAISGWFEPDPEKLFPDSAKFWRYDGAGDPYPLDYYHSEDANARLLEAMPCPCLYWAPDGWRVLLGPPMGVAAIEWIKPPFHADRKTCVVLAFCKFAGIAHKRDGGERV